jgi:hypothetical protein
MTIRSCAALAVLLSYLHPSLWGQSSLQRRFQPGETFTLETTTSLKIIHGGNPKFIRCDVSLTKVAAYKVLAAGPRHLVLEQHVQSAQVTPEKDNSLEGVALTKHLSGKALTFTLNERGEITKVQGFKELFARVAREVEAAPVELEALLTEENLVQEVQFAFLLGPASPAKVGDTWKRRANILLGGEPVGFLGKFQAGLDFRYVGKTDQGERVVLRGDLRYVPPVRGATIYPYTITRAKFRKLETEGEFIFDVRPGRLVRQTFRVAFDGTFTQDVGGRTEDMEIGQELTFKARLVERSRKNPR